MKTYCQRCGAPETPEQNGFHYKTGEPTYRNVCVPCRKAKWKDVAPVGVAAALVGVVILLIEFLKS